MGVSENAGSKYSTLNSRILVYKDPQNKVPLIFGNSHMGRFLSKLNLMRRQHRPVHSRRANTSSGT